MTEPYTEFELEEALDQFEQSWPELSRCDVVTFLCFHSSCASTLRELVHADLELRLKGGDPARVEEYLQRWPQLDADSQDLVLAEMKFRSRQEPNLKLEEFVGRFPQWESALRTQFRRLEWNSFQTMSQVSDVAESGERSYVIDGLSMQALHAEGGLGNVWCARDHNLNRTVAVKEIKNVHSHDRSLRSRFVREAVITGMLDHPGVVPIYYQGVFRDGRPFYTMRMIQGKSLKQCIDEFYSQHRAAKHQPELRRLLKSFVSVCRTIDYAHSRRVIHRDIKPANIMIGEFGETLVVDWGLAKAPQSVCLPNPESGQMEWTNDNESEATVAGQVMGSPAFMSPEQAEGRLESIGYASDIYSLGATLFFLIAKQPRRLDAGWSARETIKQSFLARQRQMKPLFSVCAKAMAWDPGDRFLTAGELADNVECFLDDLPVPAHRASVVETLERVSRRHQKTLWAAALAMVAILFVAGFAIALINDEREKAVQAAGKAVLQSEIAGKALEQADAARDASDEFVELLSRVFVLSGPANRGRQIEFREHIEGFRHSLEGKDARVKAKGLSTIGRIFAAQGNYRDAIAQFEESLRLYETQGLAETPESLAITLSLAQTYIDASQWASAEMNAIRAEGLASKLRVVDEIAKMELLSIQSQMAGFRHAYSKSINLARQALKRADTRMRRSSFNDLDVTVWATLANRLVGQLIKAGGSQNLADAGELLDRILERQSDNGLLGTRAAMTTLSNRGIWYRESGRFDDFVETCREVVRARTDRLGPDDPETFKARSILGSALLNKSRSMPSKDARASVEEAIDILESALAGQIDAIGNGHADTANTAIFLATAWRRQMGMGEVDQLAVDRRVEQVKEVAIATESQSGPNNLVVIRLKSQLGLLYQKANQMDEATEVFKDVRQSLAEYWSPDASPSGIPMPGKVAEILSSCSAHFVSCGHYDLAIDMVSALVDSDETGGNSSPERNYMLGLCLIHGRNNEDVATLQEAARRMATACAGLAERYPDTTPMLPLEWNANRIYLDILRTMGDDERASEHLNLVRESGRASDEQMESLQSTLR